MDSRIEPTQGPIPSRIGDVAKRVAHLAQVTRDKPFLFLREFHGIVEIHPQYTESCRNDETASRVAQTWALE
jgi:hypothetical protein